MIKAYIDAATKGDPGLSGGGILLVGTELHQQHALPLPILTNHQAEFTIFLELLQLLLEKQWQDQTIMVYSDSKVLVQTVDKNYTGNPAFQPIFEQIQQQLPKFSLLILQWIPENQNKGADRLARQGLQKAVKLQNRRQ
ncbi:MULTISPECIES: ribonuclease HI family protein [Enterococcus]|uniref:ribonuclease HI family protein n=1 Tax=Enterococcus TaxID=1350 RepID=UPI00065DD4E5|nr:MULTISPECIES: ribonuclease HI family protein [Enterococcus]KAF1302482.1 ribonuclease HI [Enterococcus sp. JM9B]